MEIDIRERFLASTGIHPAILKLVEDAEEKLEKGARERKEIARYNQNKVLAAMRKHRLSDMHFGWNTGYGYDDPGRMITEKIYAEVFRTESALVRTQIVNGTHALSLALSGVLRPGDELIYATGGPYDTLEETIGIRGENKGSLKDFGVSYKQIELKEDGTIDIEGLLGALTDKTRLIGLQRATGYAWRKAITIPEIEDCVKAKIQYHLQEFDPQPDPQRCRKPLAHLGLLVLPITATGNSSISSNRPKSVSI